MVHGGQPLTHDGQVDGPMPIYARSEPEGALRQSEILTGLTLKRLTLESVRNGSESLLEKVHHPYVMVASQDCDLEQDHSFRVAGRAEEAPLPSVLLYEVYTAQELRDSHDDLNSKIWKPLKQNRNERYHFLEKVPKEADAEGGGLPELTIDFKRYLTVGTDELLARIARGAVKRRCRLLSPYLEHWSSRHAYFQCRVALPRSHESE